MRRAGHPSTRHRGGGDARMGEGRAQRQRDDPGVADLDCFGFLCCLLRDRLVCFDQLKRQTSSAITACLAAKLLHQQQRKPSLTIPTPSLGHRGNTLFFRAVSSILSQRLLHKMADTRAVFIASHWTNIAPYYQYWTYTDFSVKCLNIRGFGLE